ncbi:hypothetical protein A2368_01535 [Candidatus Collierbacteria bacterium RIFOXYB1_FULL_49_13]|uniref:Uncharacterized protein n=1 Tax=Candidatus Collierbacteria bacterium RIFOXYB1_FULL_49_13 TaxID=1817728 RepID=A0A1F5FGW7_9BACT|nr:MAG: hypothetical protein A2368_01535 [Candidatus Collierbacteria bacterium RIFOXYB1_FULL_49_13]
MAFRIKSDAERTSEQVKKTFYILKETEQVVSEADFKKYPDDVSDLNIVFRRLTNKDIIEINKETSRYGKELAGKLKDITDPVERESISKKINQEFSEETSAYWYHLTQKTVRGIVSWDIVDGAGESLPITFENFKALGDGIQDAIISFYISEYTFTDLTKKK